MRVLKELKMILTFSPLSQLRTTLTLASFEGFPSLSDSCTVRGIGILVSLYTESGCQRQQEKTLV